MKLHLWLIYDSSSQPNQHSQFTIQYWFTIQWQFLFCHDERSLSVAQSQLLMATFLSCSCPWSQFTINYMVMITNLNRKPHVNIQWILTLLPGSQSWMATTPAPCQYLVNTIHNPKFPRSQFLMATTFAAFLLFLPMYSEYCCLYHNSWWQLLLFLLLPWYISKYNPNCLYHNSWWQLFLLFA